MTQLERLQQQIKEVKEQIAHCAKYDYWKEHDMHCDTLFDLEQKEKEMVTA